jgi:hypothetical protein
VKNLTKRLILSEKLSVKENTSWHENFCIRKTCFVNLYLPRVNYFTVLAASILRRIEGYSECMTVFDCIYLFVVICCFYIPFSSFPFVVEHTEFSQEFTPHTSVNCAIKLLAGVHYSSCVRHTHNALECSVIRWHSFSWTNNWSFQFLLHFNCSYLDPSRSRQWFLKRFSFGNLDFDLVLDRKAYQHSSSVKDSPQIRSLQVSLLLSSATLWTRVLCAWINPLSKALITSVDIFLSWNDMQKSLYVWSLFSIA